MFLTLFLEESITRVDHSIVFATLWLLMIQMYLTSDEVV